MPRLLCLPTLPVVEIAGGNGIRPEPWRAALVEVHVGYLKEAEDLV
jgi:hypothetical protein